MASHNLLLPTEWGEIRISQKSIEAKAESVSDLFRVMSAKSSDAANLDTITANYENGVKVWWILLQYRIELRKTLRVICKGLGIVLPRTDTSITDLLKHIKSKNKNLILYELGQQLERIRESTCYAEWGAERIPDKEDIKFVFENAPKSLQSLGTIKKRFALAR